MYKVKSIGICTLLFVITVAVVFLPKYVNGQSSEKRLKETVSWSYNARESVAIKSEQVIKIYDDIMNNDIFINDIYYKSDFEMDSFHDSESRQKVTESVVDLFNTVFKGNKIVRDTLKDVIENNMLIYECYERYDILTAIENRPVALSYIYGEASMDNCRVEFSYEEKTRTFIACSFYFDIGINKYYNASFQENLKSAVNDYCENVLKITSDKYELYCEIIDNESISFYYMSGVATYEKNEISEKEMFDKINIY